MTRYLVTVISASLCVASCSGTSANSEAQPSASAAAPVAQAAPAQSTDGTFTGTIVETMDSGGYTYMRLQADGAEGEAVWIAATTMAVKKGERMTAPLEMAMENFHSNTLNRDFPLIYFVTRVAREGESLGVPTASGAASGAAAGLPSMPLASHGTGAAVPQGSAAAKVVPNAPPTGGMSIADIWAKRASLAGKAVTVRGTVVKVNNAILGVNWVHLQDGSGDAAAGTNDLTITTDALVQIGDVITVSGTLAIDKDFTAGYMYEAILENARIR